jgi:hypothetical protein
VTFRSARAVARLRRLRRRLPSGEVLPDLGRPGWPGPSTCSWSWSSAASACRRGRRVAGLSGPAGQAPPVCARSGGRPGPARAGGRLTTPPARPWRRRISGLPRRAGETPTGAQRHGVIGSEDAHLVGDDVGVREPCCGPGLRLFRGSTREACASTACPMVGSRGSGPDRAPAVRGRRPLREGRRSRRGHRPDGPRRERPSIRRSQELGHGRKELLELGQGRAASPATSRNEASRWREVRVSK